MGFIRTECSVGDATDAKLFVSREQEPAAGPWSFAPGRPRSHFWGRLSQLRSPSHAAISFAMLNNIPRDNSETPRLLQNNDTLSTEADIKIINNLQWCSPTWAAAVYVPCRKLMVH